ncbi:Acyl carrier protein phosphodiesterase [Reichenbachiella agariperforans]|uniref:Acyl carrier protein phosphodiesterase n=1 Tax=Reichenbachiella agariperforans TaxID=156994 RepID=A0A1M6U9N1_REIAG|nr:ACP phosphodiesterase [Reichenbachiella agariperforans]SHK65897.1 Acyl carrier protein phosphodiesterase [Reichenbachiella agariperforans]
MNYLAHIFLSFGDESITIGNVIADFVKGKKVLDYSPEIQKGILIHREIDSFTDQHLLVRQGKRRLSEYRHYSGVIMDMYYDHILAKNWSRYSNETLQNYAARHYTLFEKNKVLIPEKANYLLHHMKRGNWLYNYQYIEGLQSALTGMSQRTPFESGMERATINLKKDYTLLEKEFDVFFKEIIDHIHNFTTQLEVV